LLSQTIIKCEYKCTQDIITIEITYQTLEYCYFVLKGFI